MSKFTFWLMCCALVLTPMVARANNSPVEVKKLAFIYANNAYQSEAGLPPLNNPGNDAELVRTALEASGFTVYLSNNSTRHEFQDKFAEFTDAIDEAGASGVTLFYYAGHGGSIGQTNYLIPVDAQGMDEQSLSDSSIRVTDIVTTLAQAKSARSFFVIDACRGLMSEGLSRGKGLAAQTLGGMVISAPGSHLAPGQSGTTVEIVYSTSQLQIADDGPKGGHSPYATAFSQLVVKPNITSDTLFTSVAQMVSQQTRQRQNPTRDNTNDAGQLFCFGGCGLSLVSALSEQKVIEIPELSQIKIIADEYEGSRYSSTLNAHFLIDPKVRRNVAFAEIVSSNKTQQILSLDQPFTYSYCSTCSLRDVRHFDDSQTLYLTLSDNRRVRIGELSPKSIFLALQKDKLKLLEPIECVARSAVLCEDKNGEVFKPGIDYALWSTDGIHFSKCDEGYFASVRNGCSVKIPFGDPFFYKLRFVDGTDGPISKLAKTEAPWAISLKADKNPGTAPFLNISFGNIFGFCGVSQYEKPHFTVGVNYKSLVLPGEDHSSYNGEDLESIYEKNFDFQIDVDGKGFLPLGAYDLKSNEIKLKIVDRIQRKDATFTYHLDLKRVLSENIDELGLDSPWDGWFCNERRIRGCQFRGFLALKYKKIYIKNDAGETYVIDNSKDNYSEYVRADGTCNTPEDTRYESRTPTQNYYISGLTWDGETSEPRRVLVK